MYDNSFQERYNRWKNGENYWDIVGSPLPNYKGGKDKFSTFALKLGPLIAKGLRSRGYTKQSTYDNVMRLIGYESQYGTSNIAINNHNYAGYGYNGKTYTKFKDDLLFVDRYLDTMHKRYAKALNANTTDDYAKYLKQGGYYQDSYQNYSKLLRGMNSISKAARQYYNTPQLMPTKPLVNPQPIPQDNTRVLKPIILPPTQTPRLYLPQASNIDNRTESFEIPNTIYTDYAQLPPIETTMLLLYNNQPILQNTFRNGKDDDLVLDGIETAASFLPYVGTAIDIKSAIQDPSAENIGLAILGAGAGIFGAGAAVRGIRAVRRLNNIRKAAQSAHNIHRAKSAI